MSRGDANAVVETVARERALVAAARDVERAWEGRESELKPGIGRALRPRGVPIARAGRMPRRVSSYASTSISSPARWIAVGWILFGGALGIGILLGRLIWR
jgi:hypothetical protein